MFQIRAAFKEQMELRSGIERVREFFGDLKNFVEMMPGVERITSEAGGVARWLIRAEVPVIGAIRQVFPVEQTTNAPERIEWSPASSERKNLLRYSATFEPRGATTLVRITQNVELRRSSPRELHLLAGLVGAARLSEEMQKGVAGMMRTFLERARRQLESQ